MKFGTLYLDLLRLVCMAFLFCTMLELSVMEFYVFMSTMFYVNLLCVFALE